MKKLKKCKLKSDKMTTKEKKELLVTFIEKHVQYGYSIIDFVGKPLSYFDYDKVREQIISLDKTHN